MYQEIDLYDVMLANAREGKPAYVFVGEQQRPFARHLLQVVDRVMKEVGGAVTVVFTPSTADTAAESGEAAGDARAAFSGAADLGPGVWVTPSSQVGDRPAIGQIRRAYDLDGTPVLDVVLYTHDGRRVGGATPEPTGGPRQFEPASRANIWEPIEAPDFDYLGGMSVWGSLLKRLRVSGERA